MWVSTVHSQQNEDGTCSSTQIDRYWYYHGGEVLTGGNFSVFTH